MANRRYAFAASRGKHPPIRGRTCRRERHVSFDVSPILLEAAKRDDIKEVSSLCVHGVEDKNSALQVCCRYNSLQCARFLLERGAEVGCRDDDGWTPLHTASACGHTDIVQLLLEFNADVGAVDVDGNLSVDHAKDDRITTLLSRYMDHYGLSEHGLQAKRAQLAILMLDHVKAPIRQRGRLNELNKNGVSMLHIAAACGYFEAATLLLSYGAAVDTRDSHGLTPLHVAAKFSQLRLAKLLLKSGANSKAIPGVPLPSWADEIISDAISSPLPPTIMSSLPNEVDTVPYSEPQPCSSFWKLSDLSKVDCQREDSFLSRHWVQHKSNSVDRQQTYSSGGGDELIYEECPTDWPLAVTSTSPSTIASSCEVEELYDTVVANGVAANVIADAWQPTSQQSYIDEGDVYDDIEMVMNGVQKLGTNHDRSTHADVRPTMPVHSNIQVSTSEDADMYDDVENVMNGVRKFRENHRDPTSVKAGMSNHLQSVENGDVYDDVENVTNVLQRLSKNGAHNNGHSANIATSSELKANSSEAQTDPPTSTIKRHTYINVPSDSSVEDAIYDDCQGPMRPAIPVPYEEVVHRAPMFTIGSLDDYGEVKATNSLLTSSCNIPGGSLTNDAVSPMSQRKIARRRSRLPSHTSTPSLNASPRRPALTKSYSDSSTSLASHSPSQKPSSPIQSRPLPQAPVTNNPTNKLSRPHPAPKPIPDALKRRDSTPTDYPPPPPPHSAKRHSPQKNQGSPSFPLSPSLINPQGSSPPFWSSKLTQPIPEEIAYSAAPSYPIASPPPPAMHSSQSQVTPKYPGMERSQMSRAAAPRAVPPRPLPKPKNIVEGKHHIKMIM